MSISTKKSPYCTLSLPVLLLATLLVGCGPKTGPTGTVEGKVTLDGAPFSAASVVFVSPKTGAAASADIQDGGVYSMKEPLKVGVYTVYLAPKAAPEKDGQPTAVSIDKSVPAKYWSEASSISVEVKEGRNQIPVELKK